MFQLQNYFVDQPCKQSNADNYYEANRKKTEEMRLTWSKPVLDKEERSTRDHIFNLRMIIQKYREFNQPLFTCYVDYTKAFDSVEHQQLWTVMREMGFPTRIVSLIEALFSEQQSAVRTDSGTTDWFSVSKGVRQGCIMSPQLFSVYTESIMREVEEEQNNSEYDELSVGGTNITE